MERRPSDGYFLSRVTIATIRVMLVGGWLAWCMQIVLPFLVPILWGGIIATAAYPLVERLAPRRPVVGAIAFGALALAIVVVPTWMFFDSIAEFVTRVGKQWANGELKLPLPKPEVKQWPLVGDRLYTLWMQAVNTPRSVVESHLPQLRDAGRWLLQSLGGLSIGLLQTLFAVVLAVAFLAKAQAARNAIVPVAERMAPYHGEQIVELASSTIRAVAKGVLGIAAIQAALAWLGMTVAGVPAAGVWALLVLICAVAQLPSALVMVPVAIYVFASASKGTAIAFAIWALFVGLIDNVLKPLLLGRGAGVPTLVIVIGAIGGMISFGIIGLFVGAVVLGVGYELFAAWVRGDERFSLPPPPVAPRSSPDPAASLE
ncbi:MAG TPA: AI-2E family transporter [Polyangiaceae bacterium]|nr:AI-2E family transporter [Polyangiaceae bacterium]